MAKLRHRERAGRGVDVLTRPEPDRAALIGRLSRSADATWLAELLTDLEIDEVARLHVIEALRRSSAGRAPE